MRGASLKAIQDLLGHSSIQMTMRYAHLAPEVVNETVRLLDAPSAEWVPDRVGAEFGQSDVAENENDRFRGRLGSGDKGDRTRPEHDDYHLESRGLAGNPVG